MRVAIVNDRVDPGLGGAEQATFSLVRWLVRDGHEVHVVARVLSDDVRRIGAVAHQVTTRRSKLKFALAAESALRRLEVDVIHDMGAGWYCDLFQPHGGSRIATFEQTLRLKPAAIRGVYQRIAPLLPRQLEFSTLMKRQYELDGKLFLAISRMVSSHFQQYHRVPRSAIRIAYNGIDTNQYTPANRERFRDTERARLRVSPNEVLLFIAAHNLPLKGVPELLDAVARLRRRNRPVKLVVAGGRKLRPFRRLSCRLGIESDVSFLGPVSDTIPLYAAADIYVQPTWYDPCSLVLLEALASGLPVVTTTFNGAGELITNGTQGYVIDGPSNVNDFVDSIERMDDRAIRETMGSEARKLAMKHSMDHHGREILRIYEEVLSRKRAKAA